MKVCRGLSNSTPPTRDPRHHADQRARREVELASTRDCHDDPHRRSHTGGAHSSSRLAPSSPTPVVPVMNLTARVGVSQPKTAPERFVRSGNLVVADGLVGCWGVAGQARLELAQLLQHGLEVADAGGDQPAHVGDCLAHRGLVLEQGVSSDDLLHALDDLRLTVDAMLPDTLAVHHVTRAASPGAFHDVGGQVFVRLGIDGTAQYLIRPASYIGYRCGGDDLAGLQRYLARWLPNAPARPA